MASSMLLPGSDWLRLTPKLETSFGRHRLPTGRPSTALSHTGMAASTSAQLGAAWFVPSMRTTGQRYGPPTSAVTLLHPLTGEAESLPLLNMAPATDTSRHSM